MKKPIETLFDCMGDGTQINIYANKFRGPSMLSSRLIATLTIEEADDLVRKLSAEIHHDTRLITVFGTAPLASQTKGTFPQTPAVTSQPVQPTPPVPGDAGPEGNHPHE